MRTAILSAVLTVGLCIGASAQHTHLPSAALGCTPVAGKILWVPGCDSSQRDAGIPGMKLRNGSIFVSARPDLSAYTEALPGVAPIIGIVVWIVNESETSVVVRPSRIGLDEFLPHFRAVRPKSLVWVANTFHGSYADVATPIDIRNGRTTQPVTVSPNRMPTLIRTPLRSQMVIGLVWFVAEPGAKRFVLEVPIAGVSYLFPFAAPQRRKNTPSDGAITLSPAQFAKAQQEGGPPGTITLSPAQYAQALRETAAQQAKARQVSAAPAAGPWKAYQQAAAGPHGTPASANGLGTGPWTVYQRAEATSAPSRRFNDNATKAASAPDNTITVPLSSLEPTPAAPALQGGLLDTGPELLPACAAPQFAGSVYRTDLSEVRDDGKYPVMDNGSVWKVGFTDRMTTALWLPASTLYVLPTSMRCDGADSLLVNAADVSEIVACAHPVGE